ncbi:hypothetical protein ATC00_22520 [Sinorhizobium americanum]|nr:hypothetical protein ATC00_22520 [Sinorhizobium americanum]
MLFSIAGGNRLRYGPFFQQLDSGGRDMPYAEIPSDDAVVDALKKLGGRATARELCEELVKTNRPRRDSQLAIQRASERGRISVGHDWMLTVVAEAVAA